MHGDMQLMTKVDDCNADLEFDEACSVFLIIQAFVILKRSNLLIIQAVRRFPANNYCVALQLKHHSYAGIHTYIVTLKTCLHIQTKPQAPVGHETKFNMLCMLTGQLHSTMLHAESALEMGLQHYVTTCNPLTSSLCSNNKPQATQISS